MLTDAFLSLSPTLCVRVHVPFLCVVWYANVWACVYRCTNMCVHACGDQRLALVVFFDQTPLYY